jgi:hypothetical protein
MKADELLKAMDEALYKVYNKQEEEEEGLTPENRQTYGGKELRNMFIGSLNYPSDNIKDFVQSLRDAIDKMPDEWIAEFLRVQNGDVVEPVVESLNEVEEPEENWYDLYQSSDIYYDITYSIPRVETINIAGVREEDGSIGYIFTVNGMEELPYKLQSKLPEFQHYKTVKECFDAAMLYFKAIKKNEGIKLNGMKISKPYYEKD